MRACAFWFDCRVIVSEAANQLQASCPTEMLQAPMDRFDAVGKRLDAMAAAIKTVRPALADFYGSLSDEQKARFNTLGPPKTTSRRRLIAGAGKRNSWRPRSSALSDSPEKPHASRPHGYRGAKGRGWFCPVKSGVIRRIVTRRFALSGPGVGIFR